MLELVELLYANLNDENGDYCDECSACTQVFEGGDCDCATSNAYENLHAFVNERLEEIMKEGEKRWKNP